MNSQITIFETNMKDGIMSMNKVFYPESYTKEDIKEAFKKTRIKIGKTYNFDGLKIVQANQKNATNKLDYPDGKYIDIKESLLNKEDYWYSDLEADLLLLNNKLKGVILGNSSADCPILIAEDRKKGVTALSHCGAPYINRYLPRDTINSLIKEYKSNIKDIYVYISTGAKKEHFIYDTYPYWATNKDVWSTSIEELPNKKYRIDMYNAIIEQLKSIGITNIKVSPKDTITDKDYASHYCRIRGMNNKAGQNFIGFYYK